MQPAFVVPATRQHGVPAQAVLPASMPMQQSLRFQSPLQHRGSFYVSPASAATQCSTGVTRIGSAAPAVAAATESPQLSAGIMGIMLVGTRAGNSWHRKTIGVPSKVQKAVCCDQRPHSFARSVSPAAPSSRGGSTIADALHFVRLPRPSATVAQAVAEPAGRPYSRPVAGQVGAAAAPHIGQISLGVSVSLHREASPLVVCRLMPATTPAIHCSIPVHVEHCGHAEFASSGEPSLTRPHQGADRVELATAHVQQLRRINQLPRFTPPVWQGPLPSPDSPRGRQPPVLGQITSLPQVSPDIGTRSLPVLLPRRGASGWTTEAACLEHCKMHTKMTEAPSYQSWSPTVAASEASHEKLSGSCDSVLSSTTLPPEQAASKRSPTEAQAALESLQVESQALLSASCNSWLSTKTLPPAEAARRRSAVNSQLPFSEPGAGSDDVMLSLEVSSPGSAASLSLLEDFFVSDPNDTLASGASPDAASRAESAPSRAPSLGPPECQWEEFEKSAPESIWRRMDANSSACLQEERPPSTTCVPMPVFLS